VIHEKCGCGAEITVDLNKTGTAKDEKSAVRDWRDSHRHELAADDEPAEDVVVTLVPPAEGDGGTRPELVLPVDALDRLSSAAGQFLALMNRLSGPSQGRGDGF
jgi:hypothetical protein